MRSVKLILGWTVIVIAINYKDEAPVKKALNTILSKVKSTASYALGLGSLLLALAYYKQEGLLFHPAPFPMKKKPEDMPVGYRNPSEYNMDYENVTIFTEDVLNLHGWLIKTK